MNLVAAMEPYYKIYGLPIRIGMCRVCVHFRTCDAILIATQIDTSISSYFSGSGYTDSTSLSWLTTK